MKGKYSLGVNVLVFVAGLLFVVLYFKGKGVFELVSIILGITFILTSCLSLISILTKERSYRREESAVSWWRMLPDAGGLALGVLLVAANEFFAKSLAFIFATLLIIGALYKFWGLLSVRKTIVYPKWFYVIPSLILICGIVLFSIGIDAIQGVLSLIIGIAFIAYSINSLIEYVAYRRCFGRQTENTASCTDVIDIK